MLKIFKANKKNFLENLELVLQKRTAKNSNLDLKVKTIINDIKRNKDKALIKYEKKYSKIKNISLTRLKFTNLKKKKIIKKLDKKTKNAINLAFNRILKFHKKQKLQTFSYKDSFNNQLSYKNNAINKI